MNIYKIQLTDANFKHFVAQLTDAIELLGVYGGNLVKDKEGKQCLSSLYI